MQCVPYSNGVPIKDLSTALTFHNRTKTLKEWIFDGSNIGNIAVVQVVQQTQSGSSQVIKVGDLRTLTARQLIIILEGPSLYFDDKTTPFCNYNTGSRMACIACANWQDSLYNHYNSIHVEGL